MRYSLVSRFRGTLLGSLLGESLAYSHEKQPPIRPPLDRMAILGTESLIKLGRLDVDDWTVLYKKESLDLNSTDAISIQVILATLPVALFFHENPIQLRQNLLYVLKIWEDDPVVRDGVLAVGYAIAQSLTEKLDTLTLISQIISFLGETPTPLPQQLSKVHTLLNQGAGLERVEVELSKEDKLSNSIAMAFYCFLSTLEDFRLAVLRATHSSDFRVPNATLFFGKPSSGNERQAALKPSGRLSLQATGAITGALSGAYNSAVAIPVKWQILASQANSTASEVTNFSQMLQLADALVAIWSGVCHLGLNPSELQEKFSMSSELALLSVYAAPRVIRLR